MRAMDTTKDAMWALQAVAQLVKRCTEAAVRELEREAGELVVAAARLRRGEQ